jgi:ribA/ribD-fused uncharacterized protein
MLQADTETEEIRGFSGKYRFLSNFYELAPVFYRNPYETSEHLYNALKTVDPAEAMWVANADTPGEAKRRGQQVTLRPDWKSGERLRAMRLAVGQKFLQHYDLRQRLLATGDALLIETNTWHDNFWGDCICGAPECQTEGENNLGWILMELREDLRKWS